MIVTKDKIVNGLRKLGLGSGDLVTLHSSLKSLGHVEGGGQAVIRALLETIGPEGTILMPAFTFPLKSEEEPIFDVRETPSCVGLITRAVPAGVRHASQHPSEPFLFGGGTRSPRNSPRIRWISRPAARTRRSASSCAATGKILLLGVGYNACTAFHAVEERLKAPYMTFQAHLRKRNTASTGNCFLCRPKYSGGRFHTISPSWRTSFALKAFVKLGKSEGRPPPCSPAEVSEECVERRLKNHPGCFFRGFN